MSILEKYRKGSFRGVEFDTFSFNKKENKKSTIHHYANSNRRYIEERGVEEADFSITFSIFGADDYIDKRDAMRKALKTEGVGLLVLPFEGEFNVKCTDYNDSQNLIESLGRCDFNATFNVISKNENSGNPVEVKNNKSSILNTTKSLREKMADVVNNNIAITNATSYANGLDKLTSFTDKFTSIAGSVANTSFTDLIKNFATNIPSFLGGNSAILGSAIGTLFYTFESVSSVASSLLSSSESLFAFGDTDTSVSPNTPQRIEQIKNNQILNTQIQVSSLATASDAFVDKDFSNSDELEKEKEIITNQISKIESSNALKNNEIDGVEDIQYLIKQLQIDFADVVAEKEAVTPKLTTITAKGESVSMLSYKYYDNIYNVDALIELNNIQDPKSVKGEIRIFTNV